MNYYVPLLADKYYHVVSRANGSGKLFFEQENYRFFLQRYQKYICPIAATYAWSLLPNHFHFLIKVKPVDLLLSQFQIKYPGQNFTADRQPQFVMQQFSNLLNSYTKSVNKRYSRKGALFMDYLRRVQTRDEAQFKATVIYIHRNAVNHGYRKDVKNWRWSSYVDILSPGESFVKKAKVIDCFGSADEFKREHEGPTDHPFEMEIE